MITGLNNPRQSGRVTGYYYSNVTNNLPFSATESCCRDILFQQRNAFHVPAVCFIHARVHKNLAEHIVKLKCAVRDAQPR